MKLEDRLEEARRRRALVLAARSAHRPPETPVAETRPEPPRTPPPVTAPAAPSKNRFAPSPAQPGADHPVPAPRLGAAEPTLRHGAPDRAADRPAASWRSARPTLRRRFSGALAVARAMAAALEPRLRSGLLGGTAHARSAWTALASCLRPAAAALAALPARARTTAAPQAARLRRINTASAGIALVALLSGATFFAHVTRERPPVALTALPVATLTLPPVDGAPRDSWTKPAVLAPEGLVPEADKLAALGLPDEVALPRSAPTAATEPILAIAAPSDVPVPAPPGLRPRPRPVRAGTPDAVAPAPGAVETGPALAPGTFVDLRVFIPRGLGPGALERARIWGAEEGAGQITAARVPYRITATHVRYYHADDRAEAESLAARAGGSARDFTGAPVRPDPGTLELYLAGDPPPRGNRLVTRAGNALATADREVMRILEDIFD